MLTRTRIAGAQQLASPIPKSVVKISPKKQNRGGCWVTTLQSHLLLYYIVRSTGTPFLLPDIRTARSNPSHLHRPSHHRTTLPSHNLTSAHLSCSVEKRLLHAQPRWSTRFHVAISCRPSNSQVPRAGLPSRRPPTAVRRAPPTYPALPCRAMMLLTDDETCTAHVAQ